MERILNKINEYEQIVLYRHVSPDYDAFGSQFGLYYYLKEHFASKRIILAGEFTSDLVYRYCEVLPNDEYVNQPTLGIVLDTANKERIDGDLSLSKEVIKIDHHIVVDSYGDINIEDSTASSCSQIVALLMKQAQLSCPMQAAKALYMGIVGDSNRFMYRSTDQRTFDAAGYLIQTGIQIESIYQEMYLRKAKDLRITQFILNQYQYADGVAYYILRDEDLKQLEITREEGSNYVNTLSNIEEFKVWMAITENVKDKVWRVSIRSREVTVNEIASQFNGGGHALASGATLQTLDQLEDLLKLLKEKIHG